MRLEADQKGLVNGWYDYDTEEGTVTGTLRGTLSDDANLLEGKWENDRRQRGRFFLRLGEDKNSFDGRYSMSERPPDKESPNTWSGTKTDYTR